MGSAIFSQFRILLVALFVVLSLFRFDTVHAQQADPLPDYVIDKYGKPPAVPEGPLSKELQSAVKTTFFDSTTQSTWGKDQEMAISKIAKSKDPRIVWLISDLLRFVPSGELNSTLAYYGAQLLGIEAPTSNHWGILTNHLIAWDIPAPPDYLQAKRTIFTSFVPGWDKIFVEGSIDWRHVSWGGVLIDSRAYDKTDEPCNCIPAVDNPKVSSAKDATWIKDEDIVFGIEVNGQYRAYPRRIMEVREMVNDTLGGRLLGSPIVRYAAQRRPILPTGYQRELSDRFCARQDYSSAPTR